MLQSLSFVVEFLNYVSLKLLSDVLEKLGLISKQNKFNVSFYENLAVRETSPIIEDGDIKSVDFTSGESCSVSGVCSALKRAYEKMLYFDGLTLNFNDGQEIEFYLFSESVYFGMSYTSIILYSMILIGLAGYFRNPIKRTLTVLRNLITDLSNSFKKNS